MKSKFLRQKMFLLALVVTTSLYADSQKTVTVISTKENTYGNGTCTLLNIPELNNNPDAIIFVTPLAKASHPLAAYYIKSKKDTVQWSILNLDNTVMQPGTQFNVQYYTQPDTTHFVHVVTPQNSKKNASYIDHAGLNDNPNAQISFFQNLAPILRGGIANNYDLQIQYDNTLGRWYMSNSNNQPLSYATAYNIVFSHGAFTPKSQDTAIIPTVGQGPATGINSTTVLPGIWITVKGAAQGLFKPSEQVKGLEDKIRSISYEMEILRPTDIVSGMTTLNKNYAPIIIKKLAGPSSLQFIQALKTNETLTSVTLEVVAMFTNKIIYKIILTNAIVSYFKQSFEGTPNLLTDFIKLTFQKIEFDYSYPVIQVTDMWNPPAN